MLRKNLIRTSVLAVILLGGSVLAYNAVNTAQGFAEPSEHHAVLEHTVGVWNASCKMYMAEGAEPMPMKGTETNTRLGGFWVVSKFEGSMMGMPFLGYSQIGYDSKTKKYIGTWIDSMSETFTVMEGRYVAETKTMIMEYEQDTGAGPVDVVSEDKFVDENTREFRMYYKKEDGSRWLGMAADYTKVP